MYSRMYNFINYTINPVVGCYHNCIYCWSRRLAKRFKHKCKYCYQFIPHTHLERLYRDYTCNAFKRTMKNKTYFICSMADLFGNWVDSYVIETVFDFIRFNSQSTFFLETKNPSRLFKYMDEIPLNTIVSTTIETNKYPFNFISNAPSPEIRYLAFRDLEHPYKHVSIEPIIDFDFDILLEWIRDIQPVMVSIGYDNYGILKKYGIPEPPIEKVNSFIFALTEFTKVEDKRRMLF